MAATRITAHQIRLNPTPEEASLAATGGRHTPICLQLGPGSMEPAVCRVQGRQTGAETHCQRAEEAVPGDAGNGLSLDAGGHQVCH